MAAACKLSNNISIVGLYLGSLVIFRFSLSFPRNVWLNGLEKTLHLI